MVDLSAGISLERDTAATAIASVTQPVAADALGNDSRSWVVIDPSLRAWIWTRPP